MALKKSEPFLTIGECIAEGKKFKDDSKDEILDLKHHNQPITDQMEMLKLIYIWILNRKLRVAKKNRECGACVEGQPGSQDRKPMHMDVLKTGEISADAMQQR